MATETSSAAASSHPVVFEDGDGYRMLYAGKRTIATPSASQQANDGNAWSAQGRALRPQAAATGIGFRWSRTVSVPCPTAAGACGTPDTTALDGASAQPRATTARTGPPTTPRAAYQFGLGEPGTWDDSGVKDAWVIADDSGEHLWYSGFDGDAWRIGYAFRASGEQAFTRPVLAGTDDPRYLIDFGGSPFHRSDVTRPVVQQ